jgi:hypothetical protein
MEDIRMQETMSAACWGNSGGYQDRESLYACKVLGMNIIRPIDLADFHILIKDTSLQLAQPDNIL